MTVKLGIWRIDGDHAQRLPPRVIDSEERLERILESHLDILGLGDLLSIGRQVTTEFGKRIDLLAIDEQGDLHVIELKRDKTPRDVVAQALEYGFWIRGLSTEDVVALFARHHDGGRLETAFSNHFGVDFPEQINTDHHLAIVATEMTTSTEQIVDYLRGYGVPINVLFFEYLLDDGREFLARSWLSDPDIEPAPSSTTRRQPHWNGMDFAVAVGESEHRNWDDMRQYGFVSAGHGPKYRKAMARLFEGARVWAMIPGAGYVGVGEVLAPAVAVRDFTVDTHSGDVPILGLPLRAQAMGEDSDDEDRSEYAVRVRWIDSRPRGEAHLESGMFANQNVVARLTQPFTLQRLPEIFDADFDPEEG